MRARSDRGVRDAEIKEMRIQIVIASGNSKSGKETKVSCEREFTERALPK